MRRVIVALTAAAVLVAACGGDDGAGSDPGGANASGDTVAGSESSSSDGGDPAGGGGSTTVELGGDTYEFSTVTCTLAGATLLNFSEGSDSGSIAVTDPVVLIRLAIADGEWVDDGAPSTPDRSGDTFTWSGSLSELASGDEAKATITVTC